MFLNLPPAGFTCAAAATIARDQSNALYMLTQDLLAHLLFPLGELEKTEVRRNCHESGYAGAYQPDSLGDLLCRRPYSEFLRETSGEKSHSTGRWSTQGQVVGPHTGISTNHR
jgi:tRNA-specific 2-thiouridylase